jgi:two-component system, OmpR family, sensor histidine kinase ArlS
MKIKIKIALIFTLLVTLILLVLGTAVYYFSELSRQNQFTQRLKNRALTNARLLNELKEINKPLLKKIDSLTMNLLFEERILIYDQNNNLLYVNRPDVTSPPLPDSLMLKIIRAKKNYLFTIEQYDGIGTIYNEKAAGYVIVATAIDRVGLATLSQLRKILLLSGLGGILITLLIGYFFSINLLKPLTRINTEMNEISFQNISRRIATGNKKDELHELIKTFNSLLERLEVSFNNQKSFIANASHELSTPLAAISSQLEVALLQNRTELEYKKVLGSVQEDVVHLNNLVRKLLELAKAGTGRGITLEPVRIDEILLSAVEESNKLHPDYQIHFSFDTIPEDESLCYIYGNEELLFIAFKNIIENACKYSSSHKAWVSIEIRPGKKIIHVKDEGIGISQEEIKKIFEPFFRTERAGKTSEGLGLGLSMSSGIIRLHKGEITIESEPDKGSIFSITLPSI